MFFFKLKLTDNILQVQMRTPEENQTFGNIKDFFHNIRGAINKFPDIFCTDI